MGVNGNISGKNQRDRLVVSTHGLRRCKSAMAGSRGRVPIDRLKFPSGSETFQKVQASLKYYTGPCYRETGSPLILHRLNKYFGGNNPSAVLELGCGLGRMSVILKNSFGWHNTMFYLYDGDSEQDLKTDPWKGSNDTIIPGSFHNSLKLTKEFCLLNGLREEQIVLINAEKERVKTKILSMVHCKYSL